MKKLIIISFLLVNILNAQTYFSFMHNVNNATLSLNPSNTITHITVNINKGLLYSANLNSMRYKINNQSYGFEFSGNLATCNVKLQGAGSHEIQFECINNSDDKVLESQTFYVTVYGSTIIKYDFGPGEMIINNQNEITPKTVYFLPNQNMTVQAINQNYDNYPRVFDRWSGDATGSNSTLSYNTSNSGNEVIANTKKACNINITSNKEGGSIIVDGTQFVYPVNYVAYGNTTVNIEAQQSYTLQGVQFQFQNWSDGNSSISRTVTVNAHTNLSAVYKGTPIWESRSMGSPSQLNQNIQLTWNEHPNSGVTGYEIWRIAGKNNPPAELIGSVGRGTTSFTDPDYVVSNSSNAVMLQYDIRAVYSPDNTISMNNFQTINFGVIAADSKEEQDGLKMEMKEIKTEMMNYPDPFNPSTTIKYSIAEAGKVSIRVYDITGKEIKVLVDEYKERGEYSIQFNAGNLSSGIYLYRMIAPNYVNTKKMLLVK